VSQTHGLIKKSKILIVGLKNAGKSKLIWRMAEDKTNQSIHLFIQKVVGVSGRRKVARGQAGREHMDGVMPKKGSQRWFLVFKLGVASWSSWGCGMSSGLGLVEMEVPGLPLPLTTALYASSMRREWDQPDTYRSSISQCPIDPMTSLKLQTLEALSNPPALSGAFQ
jgi:GTPase SAR1 family protein